ncbi:DoxX family protein [cf. Phormidesmis sp. LEGE 11477]|uniref:DoxX family protein n=1 Tax=cf. Phormidesmis sp. LEGE 11477 TaxID=1828680 RepID=UPI00187E4178|nr:DoxX family protein [cf. Phormidesmis sp. LEGE 11477]MBE9064320.1 DoxX family protein [cf. Phormidesmis sp. LEGE 11477]
MNISSLTSLFFKPNVNANTASQATLAIARVIIGLMMIHNGQDKLADIESFAQAYVAYLGLPFPIFLSYVAAYTELIAAPLVMVGLFTRPAAFGLFSTMCVAMYHHVKVAGLSLPYLELSAIYAACFLYFTVNGPGLFSFDALIANRIDASALSAKAKQVMRLERAFQAGSVQKSEVTAQ